MKDIIKGLDDYLTNEPNTRDNKRVSVDPMSMFSGKSRNFGKTVTEAELKAKKDKSEWSHQLEFCKWLKHTYPNILFRSDIQNQGARSPQMQNIMQIVDPYRKGWPDIQIYHEYTHSGYVKYSGLMIELKTFTGKPSQEQKDMAVFIQERTGWKVVIAYGVEDAKKAFLEYYLGR